MRVHGNTKHGMYGTRIYEIWHGMLNRCRYKVKYYENISVCERWFIFENFYSDVGDPPSRSHTLERKETKGNYEPGNVMWATAKEQARNRRNTLLFTIEGRTQCLKDWAKEYGINYAALQGRVARKWDIKTALTTPTQKRTK